MSLKTFASGRHRDGETRQETVGSGKMGVVEIEGSVSVDGREIKWLRNPALGGVTLFFGGYESLHMDREPTQDNIELAITSYERGKHQGKQIGRSSLQTEFQVLMACRQS